MYSDAGHGWLKVPNALLYELMLGDKISGFSYMNATHSFLEEDCDYGEFAKAYKKAFHKSFKIKEVYSSQSKIRDYSSFNPELLKPETRRAEFWAVVSYGDVDKFKKIYYKKEGRKQAKYFFTSPLDHHNTEAFLFAKSEQLPDVIKYVVNEGSYICEHCHNHENFTRKAKVVENWFLDNMGIMESVIDTDIVDDGSEPVLCFECDATASHKPYGHLFFQSGVSVGDRAELHC